MLETFRQTRTIASELRFAVWTSDPVASQYRDLPVSYITEERMTPRTNALAAWASKHARYVGWIADDNRFRTHGWDQTVVQTLDRMGGGIVYGNDVVSPGSKPSHVFLSSEIIKELGWLIHPGMTMTFFDDCWEQFGRSMKRLRYLPDVVVEHLYTERDNIATFLRDQDVYQAWLRHECEDQAARCLRALKGARRSSERSSSTSMASSSPASAGTSPR